MSKLGVPYLPCSLVWTKMNLDKYSSVYPTYLPKKFGHFGPKVCYWILNFDRNLITFFLTSPLSQPKKATDFIREALKSRLSLGMTSNKTYHFQTTTNHHRFIKVWTSIADLPNSKVFVQTFFLKKYGSEIPYLPKIWTYVQIFVVFFRISFLSHYFYTISFVG